MSDTLAFILLLGIAVLIGIVTGVLRGEIKHRRERERESLRQDKERWEKQTQDFKQRKMDVTAKLMEYKVICSCGATLTPYDVDYNIYGEVYGAFYECKNIGIKHGRRIFVFVSELDDYMSNGETE